VLGNPDLDGALAMVRFRPQQGTRAYRWYDNALVVLMLGGLAAFSVVPWLLGVIDIIERIGQWLRG
jgi:hypothetical protein